MARHKSAALPSSCGTSMLSTSTALPRSPMLTPMLQPLLHASKSKSKKYNPPKSDPSHRRRHHHHHHQGNVVAWVPDSLAERCYSCQASFSLMLRRHHCRRCGNVFCDACSSARMPLVNSGFVTPVRVCAKCSIAAKKAHARMVQERQKAHDYEPVRRYSDTGARGETSHRGGGVTFSFSDGTKPRIAESDSRTGRSGSATELDTFRSLTLRGSFDAGSSLRGGIMTSNGRRHVPMSNSLVFTRRVSSESSRERSASEDADYVAAHNDGVLQTLPGEAVLVRNDNVRVRFLGQIEHVGRLYVTNYRLVFSPASTNVWSKSEGQRLRNNVREDEVPYACDVRTESLAAYQAIPLVTIERVKRKEMVETDSGLLEVVGKDFRRLQFVFEGLVSKQTFSKFDRTYALVRLHAQGEPDGKVDEFAKFSLERFDGVNGAVDGWRIYNAVTEFQRMGISSSSDRWRLSFANSEYELCSTYPSVLAVPTSASDSVLAVASKFRSKCRIPVLSWRDRYTGAVICRSSQPLVGLGQKQCDKDVFLIQAIAATNPSSSKLVIIDARPWKNAVAQKTVGRAGYELTEHYETRHTTAPLKYADMVEPEHNAAASAAANLPSKNVAGASDAIDVHESNGWDGSGGGIHSVETTDSPLVLTECKLIFMGIENIHTMRKSYQRLMDLCTTKQSNDKWLDQLASTHWMDHISRILDSAVEIARIVKEQKSSVLIHCSDGWDRTAQLTSLTELLIDPHYRTFVGFQQLIEKEWCSFGHKFRDRTSHGASNNSNESSPIFLQWIDCVWQVLVQFPSAFEFNERYLILILDHLYSCRFGTFLYNSERERVEQEALHPTQSLWSYLSTVDHAVVANPFYQPHNAPRMKWKASVTATRQCFERPVGQAYEESPQAISHMTHEDCDFYSWTDDYQDYERVRDAFDLSNQLVADSKSPTSRTRESTVAVVSSSSHSRTDAADASVNAYFESKLLQRHYGDSNESQLGSEVFDGWDSDEESDMTLFQPSCHHKLVRDLDAGFSFPQATEVSSISKIPSSPPVAPRCRSFYFGRNAEDGGAGAKAFTPKSRSSLTSLFMPAVERVALPLDAAWNNSDTDAASEDEEIGRYSSLDSHEDVIIPSCSMKSLQFWAHYYLRWDPKSHFERDASVELETLHLDLIKRFETMKKQIELLQQDRAVKWEHKRQHFLYDSQGSCTGRESTPGVQSLPKGSQRKTVEGSSTSSQDSGSNRADAYTAGSNEARATSTSLDDQIARLKGQKLERLEEAEEIYQEQLARLLKES